MEDLLTTEDLACIVKQEVSTVQMWHRKAFGPPSARIGKRIMYRRSDVEAWIAERFNGATGTAA